MSSLGKLSRSTSPSPTEGRAASSKKSFGREAAGGFEAAKNHQTNVVRKNLTNLCDGAGSGLVNE